MTSTADIQGCAAAWLLMVGLVVVAGLFGASSARGAEPTVAERDGWVADTRAVLRQMI